MVKEGGSRDVEFGGCLDLLAVLAALDFSGIALIRYGYSGFRDGVQYY